MVHILLKQSTTGYKRNFFKGGNKNNGGARLLASCEVPRPWSVILGRIDSHIEELFDKSPDVSAEGCHSALVYLNEWR